MITGLAADNISPLQITRTVSGMGTSGISISCLTFSAPMDDIIEIQKTRAPAVVVTGIDGLNTQWWVDKRTVKNGIMTFTCYDTLAFADSTYFTEDDFEQTVLESIGSVNTVAVLDIIRRKLERGNSLEINSGGGASYCRFTADALIGQTVSSVLSTIADCACGYWCIDNSNTIRLVRYDGYNGGIIWAGNDYTAPDIGMSIDVSGIDASLDSGEIYSYRSESGNTETGYIFDVNTHGTMTKADVDNLGSAVCGENKYRNGSVEKIITQNVPELGCYFQGIVINNITANIDCSGIICSISANEVSGGEIGRCMGEITRQLNDTVKQGEVMGKNVMMTAYQGLVFLKKNDSSGNAGRSVGDKTEVYGFNVKDKGITVYDGSTVSKYPAEKIIVSDSADSVEYTTANGVKAALELVWDGDILTSFKRRFTDENGKEIYVDKENENG